MITWAVAGSTFQIIYFKLTYVQRSYIGIILG